MIYLHELKKNLHIEGAPYSFEYVCWYRCHLIYLFPFQNLHQMSSSLLEMLDDPDESTRELALSLLVGILEKQVRFCLWWEHKHF